MRVFPVDPARPYAIKLWGVDEELQEQPCMEYLVDKYICT
jgi:hypothetical protein